MPPPTSTTTTIPAGGTTYEVAVGQFFYNPTPITIKAGDTIRWKNEDIPHTVTSGSSPNPDGIWDSGVFLKGEVFSRVFNQAGTFKYFCVIHPTDMKGTVTVTP